jgi:Cu2+-exporting ATPase
MAPPAADYRLVDEPAELAEIARELPPRGDGLRRLETVLTVDGVHCAACVVAIEAALRDHADEVSVSAATRRVRLVFRPETHPLSSLLERIARLGYRPRPVSGAALETARGAGRRAALWRMLVALLCMMQVMMYAVPRYLAGPGEMPPDLARLLLWAEWVLTLPVLAFAAWPFFGSAWRDLRAGRIGMDLPVALGIAVTFVASSIAALAGGDDTDVYFDSVTMFVAFLLVGRWLEAAARERAVAGVGDLLARLPPTVERLDADGRAERVSLRALQPGDRIRVAVGEAVPADGEVADGRSHADESLLTGESRPVSKTVGDAVAAGSLNLSGPLLVRVVRAPRDSRLAEITRLVEVAAATKPRIAQLADRWAGPFLAAVLVLAAGAWLAWLWIDPARAPWIAAAVLVVTCPCALSLATPTALLAATGRLSRDGLLARSPQVIEALAQADTFVFDKTGTLTLDRVALAGVRPSGVRLEAGGRPLDEATALAIAAALEAGSIHPLAAALRRAAPDSGAWPPVRDVREHGGAGIAGQVLLDGRWRDSRIGHARFAADPAGAGVIAPDPTSATGSTVLTIDGRGVAHFAFAETVRPDAGATLRALAADGATVQILSGDDAPRVARVAAQLGVDGFVAEARPEDKVAYLSAQQAAGRRVAMVGDGINDAPVLARADVSVAFAGAAPLAQHHADLLLLGERLGPLVEARRLARRTMAVVRQNLVFAVAYNALALPLALIGWLPPWLAGAGMAASSLVVVLNALRLAGGGAAPAAVPAGPPAAAVEPASPAAPA